MFIARRSWEKYSSSFGMNRRIPVCICTLHTQTRVSSICSQCVNTSLHLNNQYRLTLCKWYNCTGLPLEGNLQLQKLFHTVCIRIISCQNCAYSSQDFTEYIYKGRSCWLVVWPAFTGTVIKNRLYHALFIANTSFRGRRQTDN